MSKETDFIEIAQKELRADQEQRRIDEYKILLAYMNDIKDDLQAELDSKRHKLDRVNELLDNLDDADGMYKFLPPFICVEIGGVQRNVSKDNMELFKDVKYPGRAMQHPANYSGSVQIRTDDNGIGFGSATSNRTSTLQSNG